MVVAYLMTVTHYGWEECLSAVKAVRSFVGPNYGFQQQLQEYQTMRVAEVKTLARAQKLRLEILQSMEILVSVFWSDCVKQGQQSVIYHLHLAGT